MIKIAQIKLQKYGLRGTALSIPQVWVKDNNLPHGKTVPIYRISQDGVDILIISPREITGKLTIEKLSAINLNKSDDIIK